MTQEVIERVEQLGKEDNQIKIINGVPLFEWEDGSPVEENEIKEDIGIIL